MGKALTERFDSARRTFEEADQALGLPLSKLCFQGPDEELKRTEITQPAILTTSIAAFRVLREAAPDLKMTFAAGHSLGEWSALVAAGALEFHDAVRLVHTRGRLMQEAVPMGQGAMQAVIGLPPERIQEICAQVQGELGQVVAPANYNGPEQTVISGAQAGVEAAAAGCQEAGASKVVPLPVSAPFHCPLMEPAAVGLGKALEPVEVRRPQIPVVTNVDARPNEDPVRVKTALVEQVTAPVRWVETIRFLVAEGETTALELGPGRVLMGLARRIDRKLKVHPIFDPDSLEKSVSSL